MLYSPGAYTTMLDLSVVSILIMNYDFDSELIKYRRGQYTFIFCNISLLQSNYHSD